MIPGDLGARLRMLSEASFLDSEPPVQGTARVREIQARLPQLVPGQQFTAHVTRALPDGTFQAVVAGQNYTLALGQPAKPGDTLELVVTRNTRDAIFARAAAENPTAMRGGEAGRGADLSPTGRLISFLLSGSSPAQSAQLNGGRPLLNAPPAPGTAELAPMLRTSLSQSGLFYEAHQQQWLSGKLDTQSLRLEPQGQFQPARAATSPSNAQAALTAQNTSGGNAGPSGAASGGTSASAAPASAQEAMQQQSINRLAPMPDRLVPIVHQQLDAMASQNYVIYGQAWPGQHFEWEIRDPHRDARARAHEDEAHTWDTTLRLQMPHLGDIEAHLRLTPKGVSLRLRAEDESALQALSAGQQQLAETLAAANVPLTGFVTEPRDE